MIPAMQIDLPKSQAGGVCIPAEEAFQKGLAALHADRRNVALLNIAATFGILAGAIYVLGPVSRPVVVCSRFCSYRSHAISDRHGMS
jgi:hypothetical protein